MPKLTQQQVQFIFNYLENSGIEYLDARVEMTDHVASALEALDNDFYYNFKAYMLEHKESLMAQYDKFKKIAFRKGLNILKSNILSLWFVAAVAVLVLLKYPAAGYFNDETIMDMYRWVSITPYFTVGLYFGCVRTVNNQLFSTLDQLLWPIVFFQIMDVRLFFEELMSVAIYYSFTTVLTTATLVSFVKIYRRYNRLYVQNLKLS